MEGWRNEKDSGDIIAEEDAISFNRTKGTISAKIFAAKNLLESASEWMEEYEELSSIRARVMELSNQLEPIQEEIKNCRESEKG